MAEKAKTENKEKMVKIRIPKDRSSNEDLFVSVNEKTYLVKRGVEVEVPASVAEVIARVEEMEDNMYEATDRFRI